MPPSKTNRTSRQKDANTPAQSGAQSADKPLSARKGRAASVKSEAGETTTQNTHRKTTTAPVEESLTAATPKTMAASAATGFGSVRSAIASTALPVTEAAQPVADILMPEVTTSQIAELAHSYFVARGHQHGYADEDWHRAESELRKAR